jgi:hypothetical protein
MSVMLKVLLEGIQLLVDHVVNHFMAKRGSEDHPKHAANAKLIVGAQKASNHVATIRDRDGVTIYALIQGSNAFVAMVHDDLI